MIFSCLLDPDHPHTSLATCTQRHALPRLRIRLNHWKIELNNAYERSDLGYCGTAERKYNLEQTDQVSCRISVSLRQAETSIFMMSTSSIANWRQSKRCCPEFASRQNDPVQRSEPIEANFWLLDCWNEMVLVSGDFGIWSTEKHDGAHLEVSKSSISELRLECLRYERQSSSSSILNYQLSFLQHLSSTVSLIPSHR